MTARTRAAKVPTVASDARHPELEKAIEREPNDASGYSVLADWLQTQGDPRGELAALQLAKREKAARGFIERHAASLLGPLANYQKYRAGHESPRSARDAFRWRYGFIRAARIGMRHGPPKGRWTKSWPLDEILAHVLAHPSARFLTDLMLLGASGRADLSAQIELLVARAPKTLRELVITNHDDEAGWEGGDAPDLGSLSNLWPVLSELETLFIKSSSMELGTIALPNLRRAEFATLGLSAANGRSIATARWPKLELLSVDYGYRSHGGTCTIKHVQALLDRGDLKSLTHLGIHEVRFANQLCALLGKSKLVRQLRVLDLSHSNLTDEAVALMGRRGFDHLDILDVSDNELSDDTLKSLAKLGPKKVIGSRHWSHRSWSPYRGVKHA